MLINMRNGLMAGKRLPYDAEVEYLESTGTQWIDTGEVWQLGDTVRIETAQTRVRDQAAFGVSARIYGFSNNTDSYSSNNRAFFWGNSPYTGGSSTALPANYGTTRHVIAVNADTCNVDGTVISGSVTTTTSDSLHTIPLFCRVGNAATTTINKPYYGRIYWWKHYRSGTLVRDMIPVRVGSVGYMYDRVSGRLFGNAGTGAFTYGNDLKYPIPSE